MGGLNGLECLHHCIWKRFTPPGFETHIHTQTFVSGHKLASIAVVHVVEVMDAFVIAVNKLGRNSHRLAFEKLSQVIDIDTQGKHGATTRIRVIESEAPKLIDRIRRLVEGDNKIAQIQMTIVVNPFRLHRPQRTIKFVIHRGCSLPVVKNSATNRKPVKIASCPEDRPGEMKRLLLLLLIVPLLTQAAPVDEAERVPLDLRRTTLVVRDIDTSLALYRDALGMKVIYDNAIRTPRSAKTDAEADRAARLVFLRANDDFVGVLGLLEYRKPRKSQPITIGSFEPGTVVLLFNIEDLSTKFAEARSVTGVRVLSEPSRTEYPGYGGKGTIPVMVSVITDPDGFTIELNELLEGLR